jgi:MiaB-like protein
VLTGIHISSYGKDKNNEGALIELIEAISKIKGIKRIRLGSLEPGIITEEFVERISSNSKVCPHFHLSLQSGCDSVLKRMNRKYTCKQYFEKCDMLRKAYKSPALTTDVIVGFPGETEEEFAETVRYLTELNLYEMHIFKYSPRKGTVAAAMKEQVAPEIKNERSDVLLKLAHDNKTAYEAQFEGCELEVLVEEVVKKDNKTYLRGHTERYMDILIDVGDISMPESFVNSFVYVTYTQNGGNLPLLL